MASNIIVRCHIGQACPTWDRTILSDAMSNKFCPMGLSDMGLDNGVRSHVKPPCLRGLFNMGSDRLFDPMSDNICPMSKDSLGRLFDSFESIAKQNNDMLGELFAKQANDLLGTELAKKVNDLLAERVQSPARPPPHAAHHVHAYNRRAHGEQACQTGVQSLHACLEGVQSLHALWTGVQALHACGLTTLIRVPKYPHKGTSHTLIRVPGTRSTLIRVRVPLSPGSRQPLESRGLREPAQVSSAGTDLGAGTETRHQPHKPEPTHRTPTQRTHHR
ncbi:hypothetical protein PCANC_06316, partial [Puccinia coronata f. sp. avenae]